MTSRGLAAAAVPDVTGHFGTFGGRLAPEALMAALDELTDAYEQAKSDPAFQAELTALLTGYAAGPRCSPRHRGSPSRPAAAGSSSSGRTWRTPARTRSITCSARRC